MRTSVKFSTMIDKYQNKFPNDFTIVPRIGEKVKVRNNYAKELPFDYLTVINVTYEQIADLIQVIVELHLSEHQAKMAIEYNLNVFG